jgi:glutathione S-transferase
MKLSILPPSVNNMAVRVFMRAAGLDCDEENVFGETRSEVFSAKNPSHLTPQLESDELPKGVLWESCAIMQYLCNLHGLDALYPSDPKERAMTDSAMFYAVGTLYPLVARATYPALGFPLYAGEVGASDASDVEKEAARQAAEDALAGPLEVFRSFYIGDNGTIGSSGPNIADIKFSSTLEFLNVVDYPLPDWAAAYMDRVETALGGAYSEPAQDVRGYIASVKS